MNGTSVVDTFSCAERTSGHSFKVNDWDLSIQEVTTGLRPSVTNNRDYTAFTVRDADCKIVLRLNCSWQVRDLTPDETNRHAGSEIVAAVTWRTGWSSVWDIKPLHSALTKNFIVDFFCFYKIMVGKGKKVGDVWKDVLVYVELSRND